MRIVVAEQDKGVASWIRTVLSREGHVTSFATDSTQTFRLVQSVRPDLILLDWMLPVTGGLQLCKDLRAMPQTATTPMVMLVENSPLSKDIQQLDTEVDQFLNIPFTAGELRACVDDVHGVTIVDDSGEILVAGPIEMDTGRWTVTVGGSGVQLTIKEFLLLRELLRANGRVLSRDVLLDRIWDDADELDFNTRTVDVHVGRLRRKLGETNDIIVTVRNIGYRLNIKNTGQQQANHVN